MHAELSANAPASTRVNAAGAPSLLRSRRELRSKRCSGKCSNRFKSHVAEWALTITVIVVPLACAVFLIPFRDRSISLLDASIQQPYLVNDSLPIVGVILSSVFIPIAFFFAYPYLLPLAQQVRPTQALVLPAPHVLVDECADPVHRADRTAVRTGQTIGAGTTTRFPRAMLP